MRSQRVGGGRAYWNCNWRQAGGGGYQGSQISGGDGRGYVQWTFSLSGLKRPWVQSWRGDVKTRHCVLLGSHNSRELGGGGDTWWLKKEKVPPRRAGFHGEEREREGLGSKRC